MISWFAKDSKELVSRQLMCYILKQKIGAKKLNDLEPKENIEAIESTLDQVLLVIEEENGEERVDFNWDFILFEATDHQLRLITEPFLKDKPKEKKSNTKGIVDISGNQLN